MNLVVRIAKDEIPVLLDEQQDGLGHVILGHRAPPRYAYPGDALYLECEKRIVFAATILEITDRFRYRSRRFKYRSEVQAWWLGLRYPDTFENISCTAKRRWYYADIAPSRENREKGLELLEDHRGQIEKEAHEQGWEPPRHRQSPREGARRHPQGTRSQEEAFQAVHRGFLYRFRV